MSAYLSFLLQTISCSQPKSLEMKKSRPVSVWLAQTALICISFICSLSNSIFQDSNNKEKNQDNFYTSLHSGVNILRNYLF